MSASTTYISDTVNIGKRSRLRWFAAVPDYWTNAFTLKVVDAELGEGFAMGRRSSPCALLLVCYAGAAITRQQPGGPGRRLGPGDAVFVPAGQPISYTSECGSRFGHFGLEWLEPSTAPRTKGETALYRTADPQPFRHACEGLFHEIVTGGRDPVLQAWFQVLDELGRRVLAGDSRASPLTPLLAILERDLAHPWSMVAMAARVHVSPSTLRRLFWKERGESPGQCLQRLRLMKAASLLAGTDAKLDDIAEQVGYATPFALSKAFAAHHGMPPRRYRELHGRGASGPRMRGAGQPRVSVEPSARKAE